MQRMLYLAQVETCDPADTVRLKLLACQEGDRVWSVLANSEPRVLLDATHTLKDDLKGVLNRGVLVLVRLSEEQEVIEIELATDWVLALINDYLSDGLTPTFFKQEVAHVEAGRQWLALQMQDLGRRALEMEARREEIQILEESLRQERQELEASTLALEARWEVVRAQEAKLQQEQQRLEQLADRRKPQICQPDG
ncbi:hypothetical protein OOK60_03340 [Trichothermofontia sichuanensis B231]|uniref:hypothetical protein n=1 Tax=Trichothermofontia sichuanensis TaxID=3045816 RepID=UPI002245425E|nr:hypothetical protein [Trichothermofontia sichuanensis]UZQ55123.1 hypothetical protein OOK60_03340 [Trichothermofontia sichuanensis B231]